MRLMDDPVEQEASREASGGTDNELRRIECQRDLLAAGAGIAARAASSRSTVPILTGVLVETTDRGLRLVGTDLELSIETYIPASFTGQAAMVLPSKYLCDIARRLPAEEVTITYSAARRIATITSGRALYEINCMDAAEFPLFPQVGGDAWWRTAGKSLADCVRQTAFGAATDENRPFLTGVLMAFSKGEVKFAATDGFRLALRRLAAGVSEGAQGSRQIIVPARAFVEVGRIVQGDEAEVEIFASENQVAFKCPQTTVVSRVIDGQFPNYERVIPKTWRSRALLDRQVFMDAVERVAVMGKDDFGTVRLALKGDTMTISANAREIGNAFEELAVASAEGEQSEIALRSRYLLDVLKAVEDREIAMETTGPVSPVVFRNARQDSGDYLYLIMPVTVNT